MLYDSKYDILEKGKTKETTKRSVVAKVGDEGEMNRQNMEKF